MEYSEIQEILILSDVDMGNQTYLMVEFPYKSSYELMNIKIINAAKNGEAFMNFDFIECDLNAIR